MVLPESIRKSHEANAVRRIRLTHQTFQVVIIRIPIERSSEHVEADVVSRSSCIQDGLNRQVVSFIFRQTPGDDTAKVVVSSFIRTFEQFGRCVVNDAYGDTCAFPVGSAWRLITAREKADHLLVIRRNSRRRIEGDEHPLDARR